jgi:hypothetical protein
MAQDWFSIDERDAYFHLSNGSSPTLVIRDQRPPPRSPRPASGKSKSSTATNRIALRRPPQALIVDRTFAWISHRRLVRDFERYARSGAAFIRLAMIRIMLQRLTRPAAA